MKILLISQQLPFPPINGARLKLYNLISYLVSENHDCHLITFGSMEQRALGMQMIDALNQRIEITFVPHNLPILIKIRQFAALLRGLPGCVGRFQSPKLSSLIQTTVSNNNYDIIYVELIGLGSYWKLFSHLPSVISINDSLSLNMQQWVSYYKNQPFRRMHFYIKKFLAYRFEEKVLHRFTYTHVVSTSDAKYLKHSCPKARISTIGLGLKEKYFHRVSEWGYAPQNRKLFLSGKFSVAYIYYGIEKFFLSSYRSISRTVPGVSAYVLGKGADDKLLHLFSGFDTIEYEEYVADYMYALDQASVVVIPDTKGTGQQTRLIQAMARGKPCVCSEAVANCVQGTHGKHFLICQTPQDYTDTVIRLLEDSTYRKAIGYTAREYIENNSLPNMIRKKWDELFQSAIHCHHKKITSFNNPPMRGVKKKWVYL